MRARGTGAGRLSPHSSIQRLPGACGVARGLHQHSKALLVFHTFQPGDSAGPVLVPALPAHPHFTGQAVGRWDPQPLILWAPRSSTTTPKRELGASPAWGGVAPCSCQDLLSIWKSLSLKLSLVNTCLVLTWLCCPGKFQLLFILCFYPSG